MTTLNTNFTELEKKVLGYYLPIQNIWDSGEAPQNVKEIGNGVWEKFKVNLTQPQIKGVLSSLVKKGVVNCDTNDGNAYTYLSNNLCENEEVFNKVIDSIK